MAAVNVNYENPILQIILPVIDVETDETSSSSSNQNNIMNSINNEQSNLTLSPNNNFSDNFLAGTQLIGNHIIINIVIYNNIHALYYKYTYIYISSFCCIFYVYKYIYILCINKYN